jgi:hypothetical protein
VIEGFGDDLWAELGLRATVPSYCSRIGLWQRLGLEGRKERRPRDFAHDRQEKRFFLLISCLL